MTVTMSVGPRLTPGEVRATSFQPARLGHRGFDQEQVRTFRASVERELTLLVEERDGLRREVEKLRKRIIGGPAEEQADAVGPDEAHVHAVRILAKAQQTADRYVADAQEYSRELAEDARRRREEIVEEARTNASLVLEQAHSDARRAAAAVPSSAATEPLSAAEHRALEAELAYLKTFSDVCRTHLRAYLEVLARNVDEWERVEKNSLASVRPQVPKTPQLSP
jgi:DivIVA domain-containing protein